MKINVNKSFFFVTALLLASSIISWNLYFKDFTQKDTVSIHNFPKDIGPWTSKELTISEDEYAILETHNAFVREYSRLDGTKVYLFIVYSQNNRKVSHPPEVCYTGGGASILEKATDVVSVADQNLLLEINRVSLETKLEKQLVFYFFKVGNSYTANYWKQQLLIAVKTLFGRPSSSALIRVSIPVADNEIATASSKAKDFIGLIVPLLSRYLP